MSVLRSHDHSNPKKHSHVRFSAAPPKEFSFSPSEPSCPPNKHARNTAEQSSPTARSRPDRLSELVSLLTAAEEARLRTSLRRHELRAGKAALKVGDHGTSVYFVEEGELLAGGSGPGGKARTHRVATGDFFGEQNFVASLPPPGVPQVLLDIGHMFLPRTTIERDEDVRTVAKTVVLELRAEEAGHILGENHRAMDYLRSMAAVRAEGGGAAKGRTAREE